MTPKPNASDPAAALGIRLRNPSSISRCSKNHIKLDPMVCSTSGVKTGILPVCVVLKSPNWCMSATPVCCFEIGWTEERLHIEVILLLSCQCRFLGVGRDLVESRFIGVVSDQIGLLLGKVLVSSYIDPSSMFEI